MGKDDSLKFRGEVSRETSQRDRKKAKYSGNWVEAGFRECPKTVGDADQIVAARKFIECLHCYPEVKDLIFKEERKANEVASFIRGQHETHEKGSGTIVKYVQLYRRYCVAITAADVVNGVRAITATPEARAAYPTALTEAAWSPVMDIFSRTSIEFSEVAVMEEAIKLQQARLRRAMTIESEQFRGMLWPAIDKTQEVLTKMVHQLGEMKMNLGIYRRVPVGVDLTVRRGADERFKNLSDQERSQLAQFASTLMQAINVTHGKDGDQNP